MRAFTWSRGLVWSIVLTWPWLLWLSAKTSPGMILRGITSDSSAIMPLFADLVLCLGAIYAVKSRRGLNASRFRTSEKLFSGPHFGKSRARQGQRTEPNQRKSEL